MRVSIVTVAFNSAATIAATMRSVAEQTYDNIEHLVIDGASTDDTLAVVRDHGAHLANLLSEPDHGIYHAMNKGLALATGDFVGFLNADDMLASPEVVASIARAAAVRGTDAVCGDLVYVRKDRPDEMLYLSFPCEASVRFPGRVGSLNFFDDPTHRKPPRWQGVLDVLA